MSEKNTMKAAVLREFGKPLIIEEVPVPEIGPEDVLVKVRGAGLCMTDTHIQNGNIKSVKLPHVQGHEGAGEVWKIGSEVTSLKVGDHVVIWIDVVCGECVACKNSRPNLCYKRVRIGFERDGAFAEYVIVPENLLIKIRDDIPFQNAAIMPDAVMSMYHAIKDQGKTLSGDTVLIFGIGALGLQGVQIAKYFGATVIAAGRTEAKLDLAMEFGADYKVNVREKDLTSEIARITGGEMCAAAYDLVGLHGTIDELLRCVRPGGKVVAAAYSDVTFEANFQEIVIREKEIVGIRGGTIGNLREVVKLVEDGILTPFVSKTYKLEEINQALDDLRAFKNIGRSTITFE